MAMAILEARDLWVSLPDRSRQAVFGAPPDIDILKGVTIAIEPGETVGIVGESGSGKSTLARTLLRFYHPARGRITFEGRDITDLHEPELRGLRSRLQIVFQDSSSALNPRLRIGSILAEPLLSFGLVQSYREAFGQACDLLERIGLSADFAGRYPHQLSGGQRQRIGIARAIALRPAVLVADEIVSGLDVSVQAQILELLATLRDEIGMSLILISHDLSVVRTICDRVLVMHRGEVVETGTCAELFAHPAHPYTQRLLRAIPLPDFDPGWLHGFDPDEALIDYSATATKP